MAQIVSGIRSILSHSAVYGLVQSLFGGHAARQEFADRFIRAKPGDRILDVGCGPAQILHYMPDVDYIGYDPNPGYISDAKAAFAARRSVFFVGRFTTADLAQHQPFDAGLLLGVLHHLDDDEASGLLGLLRTAIRPGGRLVTLDNVFIENQNPIARKLIEWDRGKNVRTASGYRALAAKHFASTRETLIHKRFPPYTLYAMECS
jgi:SAM-dependent methyltransferase